MDEEYDLSAFEHLIGEKYYDPDDAAVFKITSVGVSGDGDVVVYRSKYDANSGRWAKEDKDESFHVQDVLDCKDNRANIAKMKSVLHPPNKHVSKKKKPRNEK